jgi:hypothetical protein
MWSVCEDDRGFLRDLARDIIADIAEGELDEFDALVERYFVNPIPPTVPQRYGGASRTIAAKPRLSEVTPGVLMAVVNYLVIMLEEAPQRPLTDEIKAGLRRLLWRGGAGPHEGVRLRPADRVAPERLTLMLYCYTQPLSASIPSHALRAVAHSAGQIYGLSEAQCATLSGAVITRICRNIRAG